MQSCGVRRPSVRPSVCKLFCANRYFYHRNGRIATQTCTRWPHIGLHPGCAQGQGQRSRDTGTSVMSRNVCYTVRSHVLSLHALTLWNTIILSFQYKYQAARCLNIGMSYSVIDGLVFSCIAVVSHLCGPLNMARCSKWAGAEVGDSWADDEIAIRREWRIAASAGLLSADTTGRHRSARYDGASPYTGLNLSTHNLNRTLCGTGRQ